MGRHPRNQFAVDEFRTAITKITAGSNATPKQIERWGWDNLDVEVGDETIRKALIGDCDPTQCAFELLLLLAAYFEVPPADLGRFAERRFNGVLAYAGSHQGPDDGGNSLDLRRGRGMQRFPWTETSAGGDVVIDLRDRRPDRRLVAENPLIHRLDLAS